MRPPSTNHQTEHIVLTEERQMTKEALAQAPQGSVLRTLTPEQADEYLRLKAKQDKQRENYKKYGERYRATVAITLEKAKKAGIKVRPAEIDAYLKANK